MNTSRRYSPEVRERAVRMVLEQQKEHSSQWAAIQSIAGKIGCTAETLRKWVRQAERDQGKRGPMGAVAADLADLVIVTDDNPRGEDAASIRAAVVEGVRDAGGRCHEVGDRRAAIRRAVDVAFCERGWAVLLAGKGHENEQIVGRTRLPFSDRAELQTAIGEHRGSLPGD